jgi:hypothetical protein
MGNSKPAQLTIPQGSHKIHFTFLNLNIVKSRDISLNFQFDIGSQNLV